MDRRDSTTQRIARRFLAIDGRFTIDPEGKLDFGIDFHPLLSLATPERERRRLHRIARAARSLVDRRGTAVASIVREVGAASGAWIIWEG